MLLRFSRLHLDASETVIQISGGKNERQKHKGDCVSQFGALALVGLLLISASAWPGRTGSIPLRLCTGRRCL